MKAILELSFDDEKGITCEMCMLSTHQGATGLHNVCTGLGMRPICPEEGCRKDCPLKVVSD